MSTLTTAGLSLSLDAAVRARLGEPSLDVLVAGVGRQARGAFLELSQKNWEATIVAARHAFTAARDAAATWVEAGRPGRIVLVVSSVSSRPVQGAALDAAVGGFLTTIGQVGAVELGGRGITVNTVAHGWLEGGDPEGFVPGVPIGRLVRSEEVAEAVAFLSSEAASAVTGAVLAVDGGFWITKSGGGSPLLS